MQEKLTIRTFISAWQGGNLCLHPTDTLPGLSADIRQTEARKNLSALKGRDENKPPVCLAASAEMAFAFMKPLPDGWSQRLLRIWPGPLTIVWQAADHIDACFVAQDGTIAIRVPELDASALWLREVLVTLAIPFPSTSVNLSGEPSLTNWDEAVRFLSTHKASAFIPGIPVPRPSGKASSIMQINADGSARQLRAGAVTLQQLMG